MELSLNKIGIVDEASIKLEGLTVISGSNNSGKTTVGKALYSVVDAAGDLDEKANQDLEWTLQKYLDDCLNEFIEVKYFYNKIYDHLTEKSDVHGSTGVKLDVFDITTIKRLQTYSFRIENFNSIIDQNSLLNKKASLENVKESINANDYLDSMLQRLSRIKPEEEIRALPVYEELINSWEKHRAVALQLCDEALAIANAGITKESFAKRLIQKTLTTEFYDQIQPLIQNPNDPFDYSRIILADGKIQFCDIAIDENKVVFKESIFSGMPFERVYFVDDPFTVDDMPVPVTFEEEDNKEESPALRSTMHHRDKLRDYMHAKIKETSITEQLYREKKLSSITEKMNAIVPGRLTGGTYVERGMKLNASNMATGSKAFSILKKLLEKGELNSGTLLILDEPESHLHPEWINKLAEVIVMLVKEAQITVLMTTHSPNFLLAVDAYMRQYDIREKCHFYQTERLTDRFGVRYVEKTDSLDEVYADFARAFAEMNALRKSLMWQEDDE